VIFGGDSQFVVESVVPYFDHVLPVGDDTVLDGPLQEQHSLLAHGFLPHIALLLVQSHKDGGQFGFPHHRRECGSGGIVAGEACLAVS
jgi:hypothetical protein